MDRSGSAVLRQQGSVQINPSEAGNCQQPRRNDLPVSDHHYRIRFDPLEKLESFFPFDAGRLKHRDTRRARGFLHRRGDNFLLPSLRALRLRDHALDLDICLSQKMAQRRNGELRCPAEDDAHGPPAQPRLPLAALAELADFSLDEVALDQAEVLDEQNAVQMVNLVAESAPQQTFAA